jgi:hypothetical protein
VVESSREAPADLLPDQWTVKEVVADLKTDILGRMDKQDFVLQDISTKVDGKADKADLVALVTKAEGHADRIRDLESWRLSAARNWAALGVAVVALSGLFGGLFGGHVI